MKDARFVVFADGYEPSNDQYLWNNRSVVPNGVFETLKQFRDLGLVGTKVMVFGHSMGGILSRIHASNTRTPYLRDDNFGAGDFYGLVTVDTPHIGSPVADVGIAIRDYSPMGFDFEFAMNKAGKNIRRGAAWDLRTTSYETTHLPAVTLPVHAFVSVGGSDILSLGSPANPTRAMMETFECSARMSSTSPAGMRTIRCWSISQEGRLPSAWLRAFTTQPEQMAIHFGSITQESNPNTRAIQIMNAPIADSSVWAAGFPAASLESTSAQEGPVNQRIRAIVTGCALAGSVSTAAASQSAKQSNIGKSATTNTIAITAPAPNTVFHPGDSVVVTVQPSGFTPVRMLIMMRADNVDDGTAEGLTSSPWTTTLSVNQDALGAATITAFAIDATNHSIRAEIPIQVAATTATLRALTVTAKKIILFASRLQHQLHVAGQYSDGIERDITGSAAGTVYESGDQSIVTVSANGLMQAVGVGRTTIVVRNGPAQDGVAVLVESLPAPLTFSAKTTLSWASHADAVGYDVVRGDLNGLRSSGGNFTTSITACVVRNTTVTTQNVPGIPASGNGFFYLYRFRYPGGPVSYEEFPEYLGNQLGLRDAEIAAATSACAP
jgi:hypothetical protein